MNKSEIYEFMRKLQLLSVERQKEIYYITQGALLAAKKSA